MNIDLFTLVAQIVNLIILLFLLRKFLYLPVLKAVDERQQLIDSELQRAASAQKKAVQLEQECAQKMAEIEVERQSILTQTQAEAAEMAEKLAAEAQKEFTQARKDWQSRLTASQKTMELGVQTLVVEHFRTFASDALKQMADVSLNDLVAAKFQEKISSLSAKKKQEFAEAYQNRKEINVQTAKKMTSEKQKELQHFLREQFELSDDVKFKFSVNEELVCGLTIQAEEQLISWNLAGYLEDFRKNMNNEVLQLINRG